MIVLIGIWLLAGGCQARGDRPVSGYAALTGSWRPEYILFLSGADTTNRVELVSMGYQDPLVLYRTSRFDQGPFGRGSARVEDGRLHLSFESGQHRTFRYRLSGDTLWLRNDEDDRFDFDGDGLDDPAIRVTKMTRR